MQEVVIVRALILAEEFELRREKAKASQEYVKRLNKV